MKNFSEILIDFFNDEAKEVRVLIEYTKNIPLDSKLVPETRTVLELINHIAQIPRIDVDIYSGKLPSGEETGKLEEIMNKNNVEDVLKAFDENCKYLQDYFTGMNNELLSKKNLRPFYEPNSEFRSWAHFLPKLITHIALHKGVLWSYLKKAEADVNMFSYYGRPKWDLTNDTNKL